MESRLVAAEIPVRLCVWLGDEIIDEIHTVARRHKGEGSYQVIIEEERRYTAPGEYRVTFEDDYRDTLWPVRVVQSGETLAIIP